MPSAQEDFANGAVRGPTSMPRSRTLEEHDRELLALRYGADLSARQIGRVLEMRTNTVEVALHRTLGRLRQTLAGNDNGNRNDNGAA